MRPGRTAALVARWVRWYTRGLPEHVGRRRIEELDRDLHDHIAHGRARGESEARIALAIASRMVRGLAADAAWRRHHHPSTREHPMRRPAVRVAFATLCILLVPLVAMQLTDEVDWGVFDFVLAGLLLGGTGALLELAARRPRGVVHRVAAVAVGAAAVVLGELDDAPGLVAFGGLLILATFALALRASQRSA